MGADMAACCKHVQAVDLCDEDSQQLVDLSVQLQAQQGEEGEAALLAALATLHHGVLADMPSAAVADAPAIMHALQRLFSSSQASPHVAAAALQVVEALATGLASAEAASEGCRSLAVGPWALQLLCCCAPMLNDPSTLHPALAAATALVCVLAPAEQNPAIACSKAAGRALAPLLAALTTALQANLVAQCTSAGVAPPANWVTGFHVLALGPHTCGLLRLLVKLLQCWPCLVAAEVLGPNLCDILAALACSPVADLVAPDVCSLARSSLPQVQPGTAAHLEAAACLQPLHRGVLAAVQQLSCAATHPLTAACCRAVHAQLPLLMLLSPQEQQGAVAACLASAARLPPNLGAGGMLAAGLLLHREAAVRRAALEAVASQAALQVLVRHPAVAGSLALALGEEPPLAQLAATLLQQAAATAECGSALLHWEPWLLCHANSRTIGPAVRGALQAVAAHKRSCWLRVRPAVQALFHSCPDVAAEGATQLHHLLVEQRLAAAAGLLPYNPHPFFGGMLVETGGRQAADPSGQAASAAAARLFSAADVQSLLSVVCNSSLPPELVAAALTQLSQVAGGKCCSQVLSQHSVLALLLRHATGACPPRPGQLAALQCLAAAVECQEPAAGPASDAAGWLLADADSLVLPLLPLVFHELPAQRHAVARILHCLLFRAAASQLCHLAASVGQAVPAPSAAAAVPQPFCVEHCFPAPVDPLPTGSALWGQAGSVFGSELVQRVWRARQLSSAAAGAPGSSPGPALPSPACLSAEWEADLARAAAASLEECLQAGLAVAAGLDRVRLAGDHQSCHTALRHLKLLAAVLPEGLTALAQAGWRQALHFMLAASPLSPQDCLLWAEMLPLLQQLCSGSDSLHEGRPCVPHSDLLALAQQFVAGSALTWVQQCATAAPHSLAASAAALLPALLHTVCAIVQAIQLCADEEGQLGEASAALAPAAWMALVCRLLPWCGYAAKLAALQLAAALVPACTGCPASSATSVMQAAMRHVLMPRHQWSPYLLHGSAAVQAALSLLQAVTRAVPARDWAAAWCESGTSVWLSRAAAHSSRHVQQPAFLLLAAALTEPATRALMQRTWPACCEVAGRAAMIAALPAATRAAALSAVAAILIEMPPQPCTAIAHQAAAEHLQTEAAQQAITAQVALQAEGGPCTRAGDTSRPGLRLQLAQATQLWPPTGALLAQQCLWDGVRDMLQTSEEPALLSAAAHALLQRLLLDATAASHLVGGCTLLRLLRLPSRLAAWLAGGLSPAGGSLSGGAELATLPASHLSLATHSMAAAQAAAGLLVTLHQAAPASKWAEVVACPGLLPAAAAAFSLVAAINGNAPPPLPWQLLHTLRLQSGAALAPLAEALALLASAAQEEQLLEACSSCVPLPLMTAIAEAAGQQATAAAQVQRRGFIDRSRQQISVACCRLLAVLLSRPGVASMLVSGCGGGDEQQLTGPSGGSSAAAEALCSQLVSLLVALPVVTTRPPFQQQDEEGALHSALGALLAHSQAAKQAALSAGLHRFLGDRCANLGAALAEPADSAAPPPCHSPFNPPRHSSNLQQLKARNRGTGGGKRGSVPSNRPAAVLAFGRRVSGGTTLILSDSGAVKPQREQQHAARQQGSTPSMPAAAHQQEQEQVQEEECAAGGGSGGSSDQGRQQSTQLMASLNLLRQLAQGSTCVSNAMVAAGLLDVVVAVWDAGGAAVQLCLMGLLTVVLAHSQPARQLASCTGSPPLLHRLAALVLGARNKPKAAGAASAMAAAAALGSYAATPDGARALVHGAGFLPRAQRCLADCVAARDWASAEPVLQVLCDLCSQQEVRRAVLRCAAPSGDMLDVLLGLAMQQDAAAAAAAEAAMLVLRQLALSPDNAAHLASCSDALQHLVDAVAAAPRQPARAGTAAHTLWALACGGGARAKVALRRCEGWVEALQAGLDASGGVGEDRQALHQPCAALHSLLA